MRKKKMKAKKRRIVKIVRKGIRKTMGKTVGNKKTSRTWKKRVGKGLKKV